MFKALISTVAILFAGAFTFLMGAAAMSGADLNIPVNMICFLGYNGVILVSVIIALKQVWSRKSKS